MLIGDIVPISVGVMILEHSVRKSSISRASSLPSTNGSVAFSSPSVTLLSATATGVIITHYENAFAAVPILVSFIPMLMDTGGNCGSQSSTLIIRGIALGEITFRDIFKVMFKEFRISIIVGVILALANGLRILLMYKNFSLAVVISISLVITVIFAKLIGCILPLLAKKLHFDPAIMASPLITTIVDTCSILIYFNVATVVFHL